MRLEDDPSIGAVSCPHCGARRGHPCEVDEAARRSTTVDRRYVRSHAARMRKAIVELYARANRSRAKDGGMRFVSAAGRLAAELSRRSRAQRPRPARERMWGSR